MEFHQRRLPHYSAIGRPIFVTWRLFGSLPPGRAFPAAELGSGRAFAAMDRLLDEGRTGPLYLKQPRIAQIVDDAICDRASRVYELHSYVVMSNHVHMLFTPMRPVS